MPKRHPALPSICIVSDARNDDWLERALAHLPRGSGLIFRHYHLSPAERRARFAALRKQARMRGQVVVLAGPSVQATRWGADGAYGAPAALGRARGGLRLATAHSLREIAQAVRAGADAILLSPVFPTRSHPGGRTLGRVRFRLLAARSRLPVIALGGMDAARARALRHPLWAAIDAFATAKCVRTSMRTQRDS